MSLRAALCDRVRGRFYCRPGDHPLASEVSGSLLSVILAAIVAAAIKCLLERGYTAEEALRVASRHRLRHRLSLRRLARAEVARFVAGVPASEVADLCEDLTVVAAAMTPADLKAVALECGCDFDAPPGAEKPL